jgi:tetratricopeptide (TPR) repeat protein
MKKSPLFIDGLWFAAIVAVAFAIRLAFITQVRDLPVFQYPIADAKSYYDWAGRLAAGDWWGNQVFYQAPLYPYFLGLIRAMVSDDVFIIRAIQSILGALSCGFLFCAGRCFISRPVGVLAGFTLAAHAPAVFFDGIMQKTVLTTFLICALLAQLAWTQQRPTRSKWLALGLVLGLLCLARENALLYVFVVPLWTWLRFRENPRPQRAQWIAVFALGLALILLPVGYRNHNVGGVFALTTSQMGSNFYIGNNPNSNGSYVPLRPGREDPMFERTDAVELAEQAMGKSLSPDEVSDYWMRQSWTYIRSQPLDWLRLEGFKWLLVWNACEITDSQDYYLLADHSSVLYALSWVNHFGVVFPLAAAGVAFTWSRRRDLWLLYALILTMALGVAAFFVFARYRFPIVPMLILFSAAGITHGLAAVRPWQPRRIASAVALFLAASIVANASLFDRKAQRVSALYNFASAALELEQYEDAIQYCESVLLQNPGYPKAMYLIGLAYERQGRFDQAQRQYQRTLQQDPQNAPAINNLALLLHRHGQLEDSENLLRKLIDLDPRNAEAHNNLAIVLADSGKPDQALHHGRKAVELDPDYAVGHSNLGAILNQARQFNEAARVLSRAIELDPNLSGAWFNLAVALENTDRAQAAADHYRRAIELNPTDAKSHRGLVINLARRNRVAEIAHILNAADAVGFPSDQWYGLLAADLTKYQLQPAAIAVLEHAVRRYPNQPTLQEALNGLK